MRIQEKPTTGSVLIAIDAETTIDITQFVEFFKQEAVLDKLDDSIMDVIEDLSKSVNESIDPQKRTSNMYLMFEMWRAAKAIKVLNVQNR